MARKEVGYVPGTRIPIVEPGNLYDDLSRRDFTINAMAKDPDTYVTLDDDPLRILRGIRFSITKNFGFSNSLFDAISNYDYESKMSVVSEERIREELVKCFTHTNLWLKPTNEK